VLSGFEEFESPGIYHYSSEADRHREEPEA
jgi:hypothetical protein